MEEPHPDGAGYGVVSGKPDSSFCVGLHRHPTKWGERFSEVRTCLDHVGFMLSNRAELDAWEKRLTELGVEHSSVTERAGLVCW